MKKYNKFANCYEMVKEAFGYQRVENWRITNDPIDESTWEQHTTCDQSQGNGWQVLRVLLLTIGALSLCFSIAMGLMDVFPWTNSQDIEPVRLHVRANSDLDADQDIKYQVRNWMMKELEPLKREVHSKTAFWDKLKTQEQDIQKALKDHLFEQGIHQHPELNVTQKEFPTRRYRDRVLPHGEYQTLEIVLEDGEGSNWWCVLFPPLCYVDITMAGEESMEDQSCQGAAEGGTSQGDKEKEGGSESHASPAVRFVLLDWLADTFF